MIRTCLGKEPRVAPSAYVDASAQVIGDVDIGESCSIWCNATLRGDISSIQIGDESNIQDNCCLHVDWGKPLHVGKRVVVGHSVTLHGCEIGDDCLIGMGSTVLSGARIGAGSIVAAGSLVLEGVSIAPGSMVMGSPAKIRRAVSEEERQGVQRNARSYVELSRKYCAES